MGNNPGLRLRIDFRQAISGPVSLARRRCRRNELGGGRGRHHSRELVCGRESGSHDRRHAQRQSLQSGSGCGARRRVGPVRCLWPRPHERHYPVRGETLSGEGRSRTPGAGRRVGRRRADAQCRADPPGHIRLHWRLHRRYRIRPGELRQFEKRHREVLRDLGTTKRPRLLWVANGKKDFTYGYCQDTLRLFDGYKIPYVYVEGKGFHDMETARNDLFVFAQLVFRGAK